MGLSGANGGIAQVVFLASVRDQPGRAVGNITPIHPIGNRYPVEIPTPYAQGAGTLTLSVWQTWGKDGWVSAFMTRGSGGTLAQGGASPWTGYASAHNATTKSEPVDLVEVLDAQRKLTNNITVKKYELGSNGSVARVKTYENAVITDIDAGENIQNSTMENQVTITLMYTYVTVTNS
jgi:hypothetical protein